MTAKSLSKTTTQEKALANTLNTMDQQIGLPSSAFIAIGSNAKNGKLDARLAQDPQGIKRTLSTETVTTDVHTLGGGLIILRDSYLPGMSCRANGHNTTCFSIDGGLWTGVQTTPGNSTITLNYVNPTTRLEELIGLIGLITLFLAWLALITFRIKPTITRKTNKTLANQIAMTESTV